MPLPLHELQPARLAAEVKRLREKYWRRLRRLDRRVARLLPAGRPRGRVLFSYVLDPLLADETRPVPHSHTHFWESLTMVNTLVELGFAVDAISWTHSDYEPEGEYDLVLDVRLNLERWAPRLGADTIKLLHTDTAHWSFNNPAQERRHQLLTERRGVVLRRHKLLPENRALESCDLVSYLGNDFTRSTYEHGEKPLFRIPVSVPFEYPWPERRDFLLARRRFLWFGSGGLVHKGLDLVLEAFAENPELELTVCGPIQFERDFERTYFRELYRLPNIETLGWVDAGSERFLEVTRRCGILVYPSCAEGGGSSALTCMHAGLLPVLTHETSVDLSPATGVLLRDDSLETLQETVLELSEADPIELEERARAARDWARAHHTRQRFAERWRAFAERLADGSWKLGPGEEDR